MSYSSVTSWEEHGRFDNFIELARRCWRTRAYGDFWSAMLVAEEPSTSPPSRTSSCYDMAPLAVIVDEAGGRFTSLSGADGPLGGDALATNGRLHDAVLELLGRP